MYERAFDTDWDSLDRDELLERAYALGVDARFGNHHDDELEELVALARSNYDGSLIELAYAEGKQDANALARGDTDPETARGDTDSETAWDELVADGDVSIRGKGERVGTGSDRRPGDAGRPRSRRPGRLPRRRSRPRPAPRVPPSRVTRFDRPASRDRPFHRSRVRPTRTLVHVYISGGLNKQ